MYKILFFIPGMSEGGAEKVLCNLVNNMDQSQFDITVQTLEPYDPQKYLARGLHYKSIVHSKTKLGKKIMNYWYRLCTALKLTYPLYIKDDYDIEVAYLECGATKVMAASTNRKALKLAWVHCDLIEKGLAAEKTRKYYAKYDKVVCVSKDVQKSFDKLFGDCAQSVVLYNILDERLIQEKAIAETVHWNCGAGQKRLIAIGRLTHQKNFDYLIETCGRLRDAGYQFHLNIFGEGSERTNLEKKIKDLQLDLMVELKGFTDNPYPWIKSSDIVVCSSRYEGISTVVQEALILGKIVVTTPCTGMEELLGASEYGLIAEDDENGLYRSLCQILGDGAKEQHYRTMAQKRQRDFSKEKLLAETESFFRDSLNDKLGAQ